MIVVGLVLRFVNALTYSARAARKSYSLCIRAWLQPLHSNLRRCEKSAEATVAALSERRNDRKQKTGGQRPPLQRDFFTDSQRLTPFFLGSWFGTAEAVP